MLNKAQEKWLQALESGKYEQGEGSLCQFDQHYCCLGVACEVLGAKVTSEKGATRKEYEGELSVAPASVKRALRLYSNTGNNQSGHDSLVLKNDSENLTFQEIAKMIRDNPEEWFDQEEE